MKLKRLLLLPPHLRRGVQAERAALSYLKRSGLKLLTQNYRHRSGEIDMVMLHSQELVFVEVRYRSNDQFGGAAESVDYAKQQKLQRCGEDFLAKHPKLGHDGCRFDVVAVMGEPPNYEIDWIRSAF